MMCRWLLRTVVVLLSLAGVTKGWSKEVRDTLFSPSGDRVIVDYSITQSGGQTTVRFNNIQKKLGTTNQRKYKKLDEVAVVIFDRTGTYNDMKFDGMTPMAFMVPSGVQYNYSNDGYFLLQDNPTLQFSCSEEAQLSIPLYLAHYEKKHHYEIFSQSGTLQFSTKVSGGGAAGGRGRSGGGGNGVRAANADDIIVSEELSDEGLTPLDDAMITIANVRNQLEGVTKLPFPEDLTFQANHLRELRSRISDMDVLQDINKVLAAYDKKKGDLEEGAAAQQQAAAAAAQQAAKEEAAAQQARQDSIQAAQEKKADEKQKDMMWLIGGIAGLGVLLMGGKQIFQSIKNNKMQKLMMDNINKAQQQALGQVKIPGLDDNPLTKDVNAQIQREARKTMTKEGEAAKQRLQALRKGNSDAAAPQPVLPGNSGQPGSSRTSGNPGHSGQSSQAGQPTQPSTPGKRPLRTVSQVKAEAGLDPTKNAGLEITVKPQRQSLNDAIPAKYKRWRKPGTPDSNK